MSRSMVIEGEQEGGGGIRVDEKPAIGVQRLGIFAFDVSFGNLDQLLQS